MSKKVKTKEVLAAWQVLGQAKYDKLDSEQKVRVFHIGQQLKPIATAFSDYSADEFFVIDGNIDYSHVNSAIGLRPSVSLKPGTPVVSGSGTVADPYVIE